MHMLSLLCMICSDQTCLHEHVWEMCVLFGAICCYACGFDNNNKKNNNNNMYANKVFIFPLLTSVGIKRLCMLLLIS
jgi:hypothetical protein